MTNKDKTAMLERLAAGSVFTYGGIRWMVLEQTGSAATILAVDLLPDEMPFDKDNSNNWAASSLRGYLNRDFLEELVTAGADADAFVVSEFDLTSDDGLDHYGKDRCKMGLISCEQYRRFRKLIPNVENHWWTITPYSTKENGHSYIVRYVDTPGTLNGYYAFHGFVGVRPLCNLNSKIFVSFDPKEVQMDLDKCHAEETKVTHREQALDMVRHIIVAWDIGLDELSETVKRAQPAPKDAAALRVEMQNLITYTRERFERHGGNGFHPECFSTLMMAYRSAIEMGSWGEDDD